MATRRGEKILWGVLGAAALGLVGLVAGLVLVSRGSSCSGPDCGASETEAKAPEPYPFGPFLLVPPELASASAIPAGPDNVVDPANLQSSPLYVRPPSGYRVASLSGLADEGQVVEISSEWLTPDGGHVQAISRKIDQLPIQVALVPIETHRIVRQRIANGRYAVSERPAVCGHTADGVNAITVWLDGSTLTLSSADAPPDVIDQLVNTLTTPGPLGPDGSGPQATQ